ncbi:MAG: hypothetical protein COB39_12000 [Marinosulfonomonas sp.]|nr:MAG: hypothetical protein COB39_12000 [Marinosulfonomonas sp.]
MVRELRRVLRSPEIAARTAAELGSNAETSEVAAALQDFDGLWPSCSIMSAPASSSFWSIA